MSKFFSALPLFSWLVSFGLLGCWNRAANNAGDKSSMDNSLAVKAVADTLTADNQTLSKAELTNIYVQSIAEYIKAVRQEYKIGFDTLFFGKRVNGQPDDFPDIVLPETIENTQIRLINPELGMQKQKERKSLFYINLVGWVEQENAEFIFVGFSNGGAHQFDCFMQFTYNPELKAFGLKNSRFENYLYKKR